MNKNIIIVLLSTLCVILIIITYNASIENYKYKLYYEKTEKLLDEIEEDNEAYFDTDRGSGLNPCYAGRCSSTRETETILIINMLQNYAKVIFAFLNQKLTIS